MGDAVRPDDKTFRRYYDAGYRTWRHLCLEAAASRECPVDLVDFDNVTSFKHPYLYRALVLKPGYKLHATGRSTCNMGWRLRPQNESDIPPFEQPYSIPVTTRQPIPVTLGRSPEQFPTWFGDKGNHVAILTLAWAFVLSTRWAEALTGHERGERRASISYTGGRAPWRQPGELGDGGRDDEIVVDLGPAEEPAIAWWSVVLAPGQPWTVGIRRGDDMHLAPWSTSLDTSGPRFVLIGVFTLPFPPPRRSFQQSVFAMEFIAAHVAYHNVQSQGRAALAAALMLPTAVRMAGTVTLPAPRILPVDSQRYYTHMTQPEPLPAWDEDAVQLAKLMTLSCIPTLPSGMKSIFFHPFAYCTEYGAWLQGILAALDQDDVKSNPEVLTGALMAGSDRVHGIIIDSLRGPNPSLDVDLTLAAWIATTSSFMQLPVMEPPKPDTITRSNECRLLFLTQDKNHTHPPTTTPGEPFGVTPLAGCHPETWDCKGGPLPSPPRDSGSISPYVPSSRPIKIMREEDYEKIEVDYSGLDRGLDADASPELTRRVFAWLRGADGFSDGERELCEHEWFRGMRQGDGEKGPVGDAALPGPSREQGE
ncbi:hypothetical protein C8A05DRAFT_47993 [Staphylotrichum tortipilum]|uniref:Uncharacterized protein n=1 Tax=Staphylotrichum tortipilum TaxID=2831512 RepID=A0AAN6MAV5_9PEZI|nr:hypothetical protein C8A05DRAFT_47993 [Staphylotrichum longicolle]